MKFINNETIIRVIFEVRLFKSVVFISCDVLVISWNLSN